MKKMLRSISIGFIFLAYVSTADAAIRVVAYNCANRPNNKAEEDHFRTIFEAIGNESINGIAKHLDILIVSKMDRSSATRLTTILNNLYNVSTYTNVLSSQVGGDRTGVIYDSNAVTMVSPPLDLATIGTHPILRAQFCPVGSTVVNEQFYVYAIHLKSGDSASDIAQRATEATHLRNNADALGQGTHIIYAGDFNLTGSSEGAWTNLLAAGNGQAFDPVNAPGDWRDDAAFIHLHSQNPGSPMDDRFDFQLISGEFTDGSGIEYVANSFRVFGNNGTHTLDGAITTGTGASSNVLNALANASDHLPVVADYEIAGSLRQQILDRITQIEEELDQLRDLVEQLP